MKNKTKYLVISSITVLFLIGIFIYMSMSTYSVDTDVTISIDDITIPVYGSKIVSVNFSNANFEDSEINKYSLLWSVSSDNISLDDDVTSVNDPNNTIYASEVGDNIQVTVELMYEGNDEAIATDTASVSVVNIKDISLDNIFRTEESDIDISDGTVQLSVPEEYADTNVEWYSSSADILAIDENGYATPVSTGTVSITLRALDDDGNVVASGTREQTVTDNEGKLNYTLSSLSISPGTLSPSFTSSNTAYIATIEADVKTFKINAVATSNHSILIYDEDGETYSNNSDISWSRQTQFTICVGDNLSSVSDECEKTYTLLVTKETASLLPSYLESLSIGSDVFDVDDSSLFICDDRGDKLSCELEYTVLQGTEEINIGATALTGYHFLEGNGPGNYALSEDGTVIALQIAKNGEQNAIAVYVINITVQAGNTPIDNSTTQNNVSSPDTGDMSSFIIFMIMLASLVASLFVYKRNVESN